ncbi:MAG: YraN family protein [Candidatus Paceibacterota bacterium]
MNHRNSSELGSIGESIACGYLGGKGYIIIDKNFRTRFGEIDIIVKSPLKTLVFVEVKTMTNSYAFSGSLPESYPHISGNESDYIKQEDQLSKNKLFKFRRISQWYANQNPELSKDGYQLDAICISLSPEEKLLSLRHYENI